jgi:hypothetical protein
MHVAPSTPLAGRTRSLCAPRHPTNTQIIEGHDGNRRNSRIPSEPPSGVVHATTTTRPTAGEADRRLQRTPGPYRRAHNTHSIRPERTYIGLRRSSQLHRRLLSTSATHPSVASIRKYHLTISAPREERIAHSIGPPSPRSLRRIPTRPVPSPGVPIAQLDRDWPRSDGQQHGRGMVVHSLVHPS